MSFLFFLTVSGNKEESVFERQSFGKKRRIGKESHKKQRLGPFVHSSLFSFTKLLPIGMECNSSIRRN